MFYRNNLPGRHKKNCYWSPTCSTLVPRYEFWTWLRCRSSNSHLHLLSSCSFGFLDTMPASLEDQMFPAKQIELHLLGEWEIQNITLSPTALKIYTFLKRTYCKFSIKRRPRKSNAVLRLIFKSPSIKRRILGRELLQTQLDPG